MIRPDVIIVQLRRPNQSNPRERRSDPYWEFGSFGCTGCHQRNIMNPMRIHEVDGSRIGFAQGGAGEVRLVFLTPPVDVLRHKIGCELRWKPAKMPLRYESAPLLVDQEGRTDFPALRRLFENVDRSQWVARFSSAFRSRRTPLPPKVGGHIIERYERFEHKLGRNHRCGSYIDAMPSPPPCIEKNRRLSYDRFMAVANGQKQKRRC